MFARAIRSSEIISPIGLRRMSILSRSFPDPFFTSPFASHFDFRPTFPRFEMNVDEEEVKDLQSELDKAYKGKERYGHSYSHSTFTTHTDQGVKKHEIRTYKAADGREIVKEIRTLGDQTHEVTKIKGLDDAEETLSSNITDTKSLEEFNNKWGSDVDETQTETLNASSTTEALHDASKEAFEEASPSSAFDKQKEIQNLKNQISAIQDRIKQIENDQ